ncbi:transcriptional regulator family: Fungal Specific TF [Aspergillus niger]|nr:transcriptional regulator family: Fungal Specific TF [Aspergillus niger]KAI2838696.1 transcriptional regulator family: Fungal Specific TF [Aspergillus niger]KAI2846161.1 transcriptional regulator family: Fungal Specific TF [Aspergillus niger]KAI2872394.1 transcriptional regulator family: Fungal Specific TF [Aspergillus niger]KAI2880962.1 transcriptional regulator family: Fungal Specific TF [Aspergillus niger]
MKLSHPVEDDFVFVNISRPDEIKSASTQRTIRRHVMRDIGRSRRTRPEQRTWSVGLRAPSDPVTEHIPAPIDPCNTTFYPTPMSDRALQLMHFMTTDRDYVFRPFRTVWFSMALTDATAILVALANAAMFLDQRLRAQGYQYETSTECLSYYGQCVRQVTHRLADTRESISQGVITAILGLTCHDLYVGTLDRWKIHISGLGRILHLRGGYRGLDDSITHFAIWLDVVGSVMEDSRPRLPTPPGYAAQIPDMLSPTLRSLLRDIIARYDCFRDVAAAFSHVSFIVRYTDGSLCRSETAWVSEDNLTVIELFGPATHFLLSMSRPTELDLVATENPIRQLREALRLVLLLFLATMKQDIFLFTAHERQYLQWKLSTLIPQMERTDYDDSCLKLHLWVLVTVSRLSRSTQPGLYLDDIRSLLDLLGMGSKEGIDLVERILSINILDVYLPFLPALKTSSCS